MQLVVLGLNHKTVSVEVRERFAISVDNINKGLRHLDNYNGISEVVILSTCNRIEIYAVVDDANENMQDVKEFFFTLAGSDDAKDEYFYYHVDKDCIRHLFAVASSLDSLIIGEGQILSQVKKAYSMAREAQATSTILNTLFHRAITTGKRVRTETRIAYNAVSVSYAAVQLALKIFGNLEHSNTLIYGAGQMAELTARNLMGKGAKKIYVANRHFDKAQELASQFGGEAVGFRDALRKANDVDIVVTSTGAPHYVVKPWETQLFMSKRKGRPLVIIDIAVPRDVDPDVAEIKGVELYNIDDLEAVVEDNIKEREYEAYQAQKIIDEEVNSILERFQYLSCQPVMARLSTKAERIRRREVKRAMTKLGDLTESQVREIEHMSHMIVRKLLREPMIKLNSFAGTQQEDYYVNAVTKLFKIDVLKERE